MTTGAEKHPESNTKGRGPKLSIPRNRSAGDFAITEETEDSTKARYSFDTSQLSLDQEAITRWVTPPPVAALQKATRVLYNCINVSRIRDVSSASAFAPHYASVSHSVNIC